MAKTISINDEIISTSKLTKAHRKGIARITSVKTSTGTEKLNQVKRYLQNVRDLRAVTLTESVINVYTSGECASHYTFSI
jgi:hypothetical protein